jgi:hypothetical protein
LRLDCPYRGTGRRQNSIVEDDAMAAVLRELAGVAHCIAAMLEEQAIADGNRALQHPDLERLRAQRQQLVGQLEDIPALAAAIEQLDRQIADATAAASASTPEPHSELDLLRASACFLWSNESDRAWGVGRQAWMSQPGNEERYAALLQRILDLVGPPPTGDVVVETWLRAWFAMGSEWWLDPANRETAGHWLNHFVHSAEVQDRRVVKVRLNVEQRKPFPPAQAKTTSNVIDDGDGCVLMVAE